MDVSPKSLELLQQQKIALEIKTIEDERKRRWLVSITLVISILVSIMSISKTLLELSRSYEESNLNTRLKTTEVFIEKILPHMKSVNTSDPAIRRSSYNLSTSLAKDFEYLRKPIISILCYNSNKGDTLALEMLEDNYAKETCP